MKHWPLRVTSSINLDFRVKPKKTRLRRQKSSLFLRIAYQMLLLSLNKNKVTYQNHRRFPIPYFLGKISLISRFLAGRLRWFPRLLPEGKRHQRRNDSVLEHENARGPSSSYC